MNNFFSKKKHLKNNGENINDKKFSYFIFLELCENSLGLMTSNRSRIT